MCRASSITYKREHVKGTTQISDKLFLTAGESGLQMEGTSRGSRATLVRLEKPIGATSTCYKVTSTFYFYWNLVGGSGFPLVPHSRLLER